MFNLLIKLGYGSNFTKLVSYSLKLNLDNFVNYNLFPQYFGSNISMHSPNYSTLLENLKNDLSKFSYNGNWNGSKFFEKKEMYFQSPQSINDITNSLSNFGTNLLVMFVLCIIQLILLTIILEYYVFK